jgi:2-hydroxycyclohexanecarboxyl-CoA dehydrogenase
MAIKDQEETIVTTGRLTGRIALVTGGGQGVGRGVALALARDGASVVIAGRTLSKCESVCDEIAALGGAALAVRCDVSERQEVQKAVSEAVDQFGGLDVLINNAQSTSQQLLTETTDADVELSYRSGPLATLYGMQAAYPYLVARGGGSIVNFGSTTALNGDPTFGAYAMAKEAIRGLSRVAAREWGRDNIRVNVVVPVAMTPAAEDFRDSHPTVFSEHLARIPLGRMGDSENDIGRAIASLVSDDLNYMTGQTVMLTGGV